MNNKPKVLLFVSKEGLAPKGGPSAVCFYYMNEQDRRKANDFAFLPNLNQNNALHQKESQIRGNMPEWIYKVYNDIKLIIKYNIFLGGHYPVSTFDYSGYDIVHFHDVRELYVRRFELEKYKGIVLLQSHTPQPPSQELYNKIPDRTKFFIPFLKKRLERMDRTAFERADYIIFPCEDAEEPYFSDWDYYKVIHENKKNYYKYVLTGIPASVAKRSREDVLSELGIPNNSFVISYVGRHNEVKGYGNLKVIGENFLSQNDNSYVVCAGKEEPIKRLEHPHWIEVGWTNDAHSYIAASDVFVLPNKETYFDIVMLEVLSLGKIVVASRTGGNKFFEKSGCEGVFLYDTLDEAVELLKKVDGMSSEKRERLEKANYNFFSKYNTVSSMYDQYVSTLQDIYKEKEGTVNI